MTQTGTITPITAFAYAEGAVDSITAKSLEDFGFTYEQVIKSDVVLLTIESASIRYRIDGGTPTATSGHLCEHNIECEIEGWTNIYKLKLISIDPMVDANLAISLKAVKLV